MTTRRTVGTPSTLECSMVQYDADFDHIAAVTGQPVEWIAPRGSGP